VGDKAYSWATKRELPEPGKAIILWEQPVHTADYALSQRVEIPSGQYGAGTTTLDWIKKGTAKFNEDKITVETKGSKFLIKKMPEHYGKGAWLFKRVDSVSENKYLEKVSAHFSSYTQALDNTSDDFAVRNGKLLKLDRTRIKSHNIDAKAFYTSKIGNLLSGTHTMVDHKNSGVDNRWRLGGTRHSIYFQSKDFYKGGREASRNKFVNHINSATEYFKANNPPGTTKANLSGIKDDALKFFDISYDKQKSFRTRLKTVGAVSGLAAIATALYINNRSHK